MRSARNRQVLEYAFYLYDLFKLAILLSVVFFGLEWLRGDVYPAIGSALLIAGVGAVQRWAHLHRTLARPYLIASVSKGLMIVMV